VHPLPGCRANHRLCVTSESRLGAGRDIGMRCGPTGEVELHTSPQGYCLNASVGRSPRGSDFLVASVLADRRLKPLPIRGELAAS
jgi:hypothetical protein